MLPLWRDFPEFWDYGAQIDQYLCSDGGIFRNNETCLAIYSEKHDPTQERTAKEIARFSERDAEKWLKLWELWLERRVPTGAVGSLFNPAEDRMTPEVMERQMELSTEAGGGRLCARWAGHGGQPSACSTGILGKQGDAVLHREVCSFSGHTMSTNRGLGLRLWVRQRPCRP